MVDNYVSFNCTLEGQASDSMMLFTLSGWGRSFLSIAWHTGVQLVFFLLLQIFSDVVSQFSAGQLIMSLSPRFFIHHCGYHNIFVFP